MESRSARIPVSAAALAAAAAMMLAGCSSSSDDTAGTGDSIPAVTADSALAGQVPDAIKSDGTLTIGTDASYAPSEFIDADGTTIVGFDIDLANAVAQKLGLEGAPENSNFDAIIVGVDKGKYEMGVSSFTINPDRLKQANMVSYFSAGTAWASAPGNPAGVQPDSACGKTIAVQKATVQSEDIADRNKTCTDGGEQPINIQTYTLQSDATTAVVSGKADAMLADSPVVAYAIQQSGGKVEQLGDIYDSAPYGFVIAKDQTEFADTVAQAVDAIIADGVYQQILDKWGVGNGAITAAEVNPAP
jgi:polar amino acid transport system substrate-binding protein